MQQEQRLVGKKFRNMGGATCLLTDCCFREQSQKHIQISISHVLGENKDVIIIMSLKGNRLYSQILFRNLS